MKQAVWTIFVAIVSFGVAVATEATGSVAIFNAFAIGLLGAILYRAWEG